VRDPSGTLVALRLDGVSNYYLFDGLGSCVGLVNSAGVKVNTHSYDPYGIDRGKTENVPNPYEYTGSYLDTNLGLYKLGIRYYDPTLGRFTQPDPTGQNAHYVYAGNNPVSFADPSGAFAISVQIKGCISKMFVTACASVQLNVLTGEVSYQVDAGLGGGNELSIGVVVGGDTPPEFTFYDICIGGVSFTVYVPLGAGSPSVELGACLGTSVRVGQGATA
jgi:RHS repeat-associated protein